MEQLKTNPEVSPTPKSPEIKPVPPQQLPGTVPPETAPGKKEHPSKGPAEMPPRAM